MFSVTRYHDISTGHTVTGHEGKCSQLHGHGYRVHFTCVATAQGLDNVGRVIDFSVIKEKLCMWIEDHWDHKFLVWQEDQRQTMLKAADPTTVVVPFNPTAENMAEYLVKQVGPLQLRATGVKLVKVKIEETAKCSASYSLLEYENA